MGIRRAPDECPEEDMAVGCPVRPLRAHECCGHYPSPLDAGNDIPGAVERMCNLLALIPENHDYGGCVPDVTTGLGDLSIDGSKQLGRGPCRRRDDNRARVEMRSVFHDDAIRGALELGDTRR